MSIFRLFKIVLKFTLGKIEGALKAGFSPEPVCRRIAFTGPLAHHTPESIVMIGEKRKKPLKGPYFVNEV